MLILYLVVELKLGEVPDTDSGQARSTETPRKVQ